MSLLKDIVHNCLIHPLLPFLPKELGDVLHDVNAAWAFGTLERRPDALRTAMEEGVDISVHELMHLLEADAPGADLFRVVCSEWSADDVKRAGPNGPRIGTVYVENCDGLLEVRLVTRLPYPQAESPRVVAA